MSSNRLKEKSLSNDNNDGLLSLGNNKDKELLKFRKMPTHREKTIKLHNISVKKMESSLNDSDS